MRKIIILVLLIIIGQTNVFARYDMSTPIEGNSIASDELQFDVIKSLYQVFSVEYPSCTDYTIKNTQLIHMPYDTKYKKNKCIRGYWKELWSVEYCGEVQQVPITFTIKKNKTLYDFDDIWILKK